MLSLFSLGTAEKRLVRVAKHCELQRGRSLGSDALSLEKKESTSAKLAMFGSGLVGGNVTLFSISPIYLFCKSLTLEMRNKKSMCV